MSRRVAGNLAILAALCLALAATQARSGDGVETECAADEIDMGEHCAKAEHAGAEGFQGQRDTSFTSQSMMPGKVEGKQAPLERQKTGNPPVVVTSVLPAPVVAAGGYGIQFGAFNSRETAKRVASEAHELGAAVMLSPLDRQGKRLWACIAGPYADRTTAITDLKRLGAYKVFDGAFVKSLLGMELEGPEHDPTQE